MSVQFQSKTGESRQLSHPDPIKEQLAQAQNMGNSELLLWVTGQNQALEPLAVETAYRHASDCRYAGECFRAEVTCWPSAYTAALPETERA